MGKNRPVTNVTGIGRLRELAGRTWRRDADPPRPTPRGWVFDAALALLLAAGGLHYAKNMATGDPVFWSPSAVLVPLAPVPLAVRRRFPLAVLWIVLACAPLMRHDSPDIAYGAGVLCLIATYTACAYGPHVLATVASLPVAVAVLVALFSNAQLPHFPNRAVAILVLIPVLAVAYEIRMWRRRLGEKSERLSIMEHDQVEALRRAVGEERARIARELHDVVTHNVSMMLIQAGAARKIMDTAPDRAREALLAAEAGGRTAMTELRHVMGLLAPRPDGADPADDPVLAPQPGLHQLDSLVDAVRRAGTPVEVAVSGGQRAVPAGIDLAAYRVVQEALTNTVKHAGGASARVLVEYAADRLRVEVTDTGGRAGTAAATGSGQGLLGLAERLAVYGGTLRTGPRLSGGFRVTALIPLETS